MKLLGSNIVGDNELKFMSERESVARTLAQWRNQAEKPVTFDG